MVHLGHVLNSNIFKCDVTKCVDDFNVQCNIFFANFKNVKSYMRNYLFFRYCTSFYGTQLIPLFDDSMEVVYRAWRVAVRRVWKVPWMTHGDLLPHLAQVMAPQLWFAKRSIKFAKMALESRNPVVKHITAMGLYGSHSILGGNIRLLNVEYKLNSNVINKLWLNKCNELNDAIRVGDQIRELCTIRDSFQSHILTDDECQTIIAALCTE